MGQGELQRSKGGRQKAQHDLEVYQDKMEKKDVTKHHILEENQLFVRILSKRIKLLENEIQKHLALWGGPEYKIFSLSMQISSE